MRESFSSSAAAAFNRLSWLLQTDLGRKKFSCLCPSARPSGLRGPGSISPLLSCRPTHPPRRSPHCVHGTATKNMSEKRRNRSQSTYALLWNILFLTTFSADIFPTTSLRYQSHFSCFAFSTPHFTPILSFVRTLSSLP